VPITPEWTITDLVEHVGRTQHWVAEIIERRITDPTQLPTETALVVQGRPCHFRAGPWRHNLHREPSAPDPTKTVYINSGPITRPGPATSFPQREWQILGTRSLWCSTSSNSPGQDLRGRPHRPRREHLEQLLRDAKPPLVRA
jgi:hypothetical protein